MLSKLHDHFLRTFHREPEVVTFAPGRIEFIGNHTDYNGGPVFAAAIDRGIWVGIAPRSDDRRRFGSDYQPGEQTIDFGTGEPVHQIGMNAWANYPLGVLSVLPRFGYKVPAGFDYFAVSNLPAGAGLSSSAAIELASARAFLALTGQACAPEILARIGRDAENRFVGVPCGILDQGASAFGSAGHLIWIDCARYHFRPVRLPANLDFWVFNTHAKHALVGGLYGERHRECSQAAAHLKVAHLGEANLERLTSVEGQMPRAVARRARHVIEEIERVKEMETLLPDGPVERIGALLTASHQSSRHLFENSSAEQDWLVDALTRIPAVHGARLTGGGFGGAVLALTGPGFGEHEARVIGERYGQHFKAAVDVFRLRSGGGAKVVFS